METKEIKQTKIKNKPSKLTIFESKKLKKVEYGSKQNENFFSSISVWFNCIIKTVLLLNGMW